MRQNRDERVFPSHLLYLFHYDGLIQISRNSPMDIALKTVSD